MKEEFIKKALIILIKIIIKMIEEKQDRSTSGLYDYSTENEQLCFVLEELETDV